MRGNSSTRKKNFQKMPVAWTRRRKNWRIAQREKIAVRQKKMWLHRKEIRLRMEKKRSQENRWKK